MGQAGRALAWGLAGLVTGVLGAAALPVGLASWSVAAVCAAALLGSVWAFRALGGDSPFYLAGLLAVGLAFGALIHGLAVDRQRAEAWPAERAGERLTFEGRVTGLPERRGDRTRLQVEPLGSAAHDLPTRMELDWFRPDGWPRPGETWRFTVRLQPPGGLRNPGGYDRARALFAARIGALGRIESGQRLATGGAGRWIGQLRQDLADRIQAEVDDLHAAALLRALVVGDRSAIDPELGQRLRNTGTAHLLAISGLHVSLVAGFGALLGGAFVSLPGAPRLWPDRRRHAVLAGLAAAALYAALSGFALPAQRALLMLTVGLGAVLLRRSIAPGRALLLALASVLLFDPLAPLAIGFWLSFAAVAVLVWSFAGRPPGTGRGAAGLIRAQLVLGLGLLPLNLGLFQQLATGALPANLFGIPLVTVLVLPAGLLAAAGFAVGLGESLASALVGVAGTGLEVLLAALDQLVGLAPARAGAGNPGLPAIVLAGIGALWLLAPRGWPARGLGAVLLLPLLAGAPRALPDGAFDVHVLDVGDGLAVVVRTGDGSLLFGTGPGDGDRASRLPGTIAPAVRTLVGDAPDRVVVPGRARGVAGGRDDALRVWPGTRLIGRHPDIDRVCRAGDGWTRAGVHFRFLHPAPGVPMGSDGEDCVLLVSSPAGRVLLTARADASVLRRVAGEIGELDLLLLPRQGHREAVEPAVLGTARPAMAVASVDAGNRWGLPHAEFREALDRLGIPLRTTADCGAISVQLRPGQAAAWRYEARAGARRWHPKPDCPPP